jgi:hypothetical protein
MPGLEPGRKGALHRRKLEIVPAFVAENELDRAVAEPADSVIQEHGG